MRALINNFKCVDICPIFDSVKLEKGDKLHTNRAVLMGFYS